MAEKTYITKATSFGHVLNRDVVEKATLEGRTVTPVVEYLPEGSEVELDASDERTKKLLANGSIEDPKADDSGDGLGSLKKDELEALAADNNVDLADASNNAERAQALRDAGVTADS